MARWKTDPLYRRILDEALALWGELTDLNRPELLRVEERAASVSTQSLDDGRLVDVWLLDDAGIRLVPILRREKHNPGPCNGQSYRFGLVRFAISGDRRYVVLEYRIGPAIVGEIVYEVEGEGQDVYLQAQTGTLLV